MAVTEAPFGHFVQGILFAPTLHHHPVHGGDQPGAVRAVLAVHQHRPLGFGRLNGAQSPEDVAVIDMIGAIGQLHLLDAGGGQPAIVRLRQKVDDRADPQLAQQGLRCAVRQGAAVERR
ncbi:hypothetical protein D3C76_1250280 [compost metagenome]